MKDFFKNFSFKKLFITSDNTNKKEVVEEKLVEEVIEDIPVDQIDLVIKDGNIIINGKKVKILIMEDDTKINLPIKFEGEVKIDKKSLSSTNITVTDVDNSKIDVS